jgi:hypothetical protein
MRRIAVILAAIPFLVGCSEHEKEKSEVIRDQIGRWSLLPSQGGYPALLFDSATGCIMTASKADDGSIVLDESKFKNGTGGCDALLQLPHVGIR